MSERAITNTPEMVRAIIELRKLQTRRIARPCSVPFGWEYAEQILDPFHNDALKGTPAKGKGNTGPRRKSWWLHDLAGNPVYDFGQCPYGDVGDTLWVRERWAPFTASGGQHGGGPSRDDFAEVVFARERYDPKKHLVAYAADLGWEEYGPWKSPRFMPKAISRITLEITRVRLQLLTDITEDDAKAEGVPAPRGCTHPDCTPGSCASSRYRPVFAEGWNEIHKNDEAEGHAWSDKPLVWAITFKPVRLPRPDRKWTDTLVGGA